MVPVNLKNEFKGVSPENKFRRYRKLWQDSADFKILTNHPLHLDLELSGACNLKCESCFQNGLLDGPLGLMDVDLFKQIIDEGTERGLCAIKLQIRGESLLHPRFFDCVEYAKTKGVLDIQVTTNGTLLNREMIGQILDSNLDAVILSVDSHHAESYSDKKGSHDYSATEDKIKTLLELRKKKGNKKPWIRLQSSIPDSDPESHQIAKSYLKNKFPDADIFVVSRIFDFRYDQDAYPDLHKNYNLHPCTYLMHRLAVFWNGEVTVCCSDYNNRFNLGKFPDQSIIDIWHSKKLSNLRRRHNQGEREKTDICRHCQACLSLKPVDNLVLDKTRCHMSDYHGNKQP